MPYGSRARRGGGEVGWRQIMLGVLLLGVLFALLWRLTLRPAPVPPNLAAPPGATPRMQDPSGA